MPKKSLRDISLEVWDETEEQIKRQVEAATEAVTVMLLRMCMACNIRDVAPKTTSPRLVFTVTDRVKAGAPVPPLITATWELQLEGDMAWYTDDAIAFDGDSARDGFLIGVETMKRWDIPGTLAIDKCEDKAVFSVDMDAFLESVDYTNDVPGGKRRRMTDPE